MRDERQFAQTLLRLMRKQQLTVLLARDAEGHPTIRVHPKERVTPFYQQAIPRCKAALVALLETEGVGTCTAADGTRWTQILTHCAVCGACDWGVVATTQDVQGKAMQHWGCLTCRVSTGDETDLAQEFSESLAVPASATKAVRTS